MAFDIFNSRVQVQMMLLFAALIVATASIIADKANGTAKENQSPIGSAEGVQTQ